MDVGAITTFFIVCDGCGCNYYVFALYATDVGAITRFLQCMSWMWVQLLGFYIVCNGCGCNY